MMKNIISLALLTLCICATVFAQEKDYSPFRLELSSNQIFTQYAYVGDDGIGVNIEERLYNYSLQLSFFHRLNPRFDLGIGLGYANRDANGVCYCVFCSKFAPVTYAKIRNVELPLELRVDLRKEEHKIDPYISLGVTARMPLEYQNTAAGDTEVRLNKERFSTGFSFGFGSYYHLTEKWSVLLAAHVLGAKYFQFDSTGIVPGGRHRASRHGIEEWYVKVGISRAFD